MISTGMSFLNGGRRKKKKSKKDRKKEKEKLEKLAEQGPGSVDW